MTTNHAIEIERMWAEGMSGKKIAHILGIPKETVYCYVRTHRDRCAWRYHKVTEEAVDEMIRLRSLGMRQSDVADRTGYSLSTVRKFTGRRR